MIRLFVLFVVLSLSGPLAAQGWERTYGGGGQDLAKSLARTPDGGYIMAGYYSSITRVYLIKTDADGDLQWSKTFPAAAASGNAIVVTRDSGYAISGFVDPGQNTQRDIYVLKTDAAGNKLWSQTYGSTKNDEGTAIAQLSDGSLVIAGYQTDDNTNLERAFVARVDGENGNTLWSKTLGIDQQIVKAYGVAVANDGDVIVVGEIRENITESKDIYVARLDATDGGLEWQNTYGLFDLGGGTASDDFGNALVTAPGGIVIAGSTNSIQGGGGLLVKIDENGGDAALWYKTFPVSDFRGLARDNFDGFFVTGTRDVSPLNGELYLLHTDAEGDLICDAIIGKGGPDIGYGVVATPDGGAAAAGSSQPIITTFEENPYLVKLDANCRVFTSYLHGNVFQDFDLDCQRDAGEKPLEDWLVKVASPDFTRYAAADENGDFVLLVDTGTYSLQLFRPNNYWDVCDGATSVSVTSFYDTTAIEIPVQAVFNCPRNEIDISTPVLRNCADNVYTVRYCNSGTQPSLNTVVKVVLDPYLSITGSSQSYTEVGDSLFFQIGTLADGDCGSFTFTAFLDCAPLTGRTHCATAYIMPDSFCNVDANWDQSIIEALGKCENDTVQLSIRNVGSGAYNSPGNTLDYIIVEDIVMRVAPGSPDFQEIFELQPGEERTLLSVPANGKTFRVIAEQSAFYPGINYPTAAVEGCISDTSSSPISTGYFTMFPNADGDVFVATDCQESFESDYNPPTFFKRGHPKGYGVPQYVDPTTDLEFLIRFQNTGTDTVHTVIIRDTLSAYLDPGTVFPGTASHTYDFDLYGNGIVQFTIPNLNLVPGSSDSEGYVKFRVSQQPDLPCGTQILNTAAIYFDFNAPVVSNQTFNTVCDDSLFLPLVKTEEIYFPGADVRVFPNPFDESATFEIAGVQAKSYRLELYDNQGRLVFNQFYPYPTFRLFRHHLPPGTFYYRLAADGRPVASGKIIAASGP